MTPTALRRFRINVIGFTVIGVLFYVFSYWQDPNTIHANPLYSHGPHGLFISIIGGAIAAVLFRYGEFRLYRVIGLSMLLFAAWITGVMVIGSNLTGVSNKLASVIWIGTTVVMFFMVLGMINGFLGFWISLFNLVVIGLHLAGGGTTEPLVWASVLGLAGITHPFLLWGIVVVSAVLGVSDKGFDFFVNPQ